MQPQPIPLVDLKAQYRTIKPEIDAAVQRVLDNTSFILGEEVAQFEDAFARYVEAKEAVGVASGTAALFLALQACGIGHGDAVITSAHTFFASSEAISLVGATPIFVDIDPATYTIDPDLVEELLRKPDTSLGQIKAILPVHLYGQPADMTGLMEIANRYGLWVIEDAAQAHGAAQHGKRCGSIGHLACFSFYPGKNLGAYGDGGMVTGNDSDLVGRVRKLRNHGRSSKYEHDMVGWGERLDALQAAVLNVKLQYLSMWTEARRSRAARYSHGLAEASVSVPLEAPDSCHVYHLYVIRCQDRDGLQARLKEQGIASGIHYPVPLHRQPAYRGCSFAQIELPHTEQAAGEILSLPMYPELSNEQIDFVVEAVREFDQ